MLSTAPDLAQSERGWRSPAFVAKRREVRLFAQTALHGSRVTRQKPACPARSVLLMPSDPNDIVGAVGDDAMITAIAGHFQAAKAEARITILCHEAFGADAVRALGHIPLALPPKHLFPEFMRELVESGRFDAFVGMGADVIDGHYGREVAQQLLIALDIAARGGLPATITGCSFSESADPALAWYFRRLTPKAALNLRDTVSLDRLRHFASSPARLVADVAFLLKPTVADPDTVRWIADRRAAGQRVVGFNLHPMLFPAGDAAVLSTAVNEAVHAMAAAGDDIAWLLLPHDYRAEGMGDDGFLRPLAQAIDQRSLASRYLEGRHRAASLKAVTGHLDGVVTGRMHLAIAALGMGTPVLCAAYQGKFAGLLRHFELPEDLIADASTFTHPRAFATLLKDFVGRLPELRTRVADRLPHVLALAERNFEPAP